MTDTLNKIRVGPTEIQRPKDSNKHVKTVNSNKSVAIADGWYEHLKVPRTRRSAHASFYVGILLILATSKHTTISFLTGNI